MKKCALYNAGNVLPCPLTITTGPAAAGLQHTQNAAPQPGRQRGPVPLERRRPGRQLVNKTVWKVIKLLPILLLIAVLQVSARGSAQNVDLSLKDAPLEAVFHAIAQQTGYSFIYTREMLHGRGHVSIEARGRSFTAVLDQCLRDRQLTYAVLNRTIIIKPLPAPATPSDFFTPPPVAHDIRVHITDSTGAPLQGASVVVKGTKQGGSTDIGGDITLGSVADDATIVISFTGYETKEVVVGGRASITVVLVMKVNALEDIVVNKGYYTTTKALNTGDVSTVTAAEIERQPISNPILALQGRVPGLFIRQQNGNTGRDLTIQLRGKNSLANGTNPLFIVDGVQINSTSFSPALLSGGKVAAPQGGFASPFEMLNPSDIESIEVLKDADATAIYGSRGANGVILITTKSGMPGQTRMDVNVYSGISKAPQRVKYLNTQDYLAMREQAFKNDNKTPGASDYDLNGRWDKNAYTDWEDFFVGGTEKQTEATATVSGGSRHTTFRVGGTYRQQGSIYPGDFSYKKAGVQFNIRNTSANNKFTTVLTGSYLNNINKMPTRNFSPQSYYQMSPNFPYPFNADGTLNWATGGEWQNPMANFQGSVTESGKNLLSSLELAYKITGSLEISANLSYNSVDFRQTELQPSTAANPFTTPDATLKTIRRHAISIVDLTAWTIEPKLTYQHPFLAGKLNVTVGTTIRSSNQEFISMGAYGFSSDALIDNFTAATNSYTAAAGNTAYRYNSFFARVGYAYREKYVLNLTGNRDGSSRFGPANRFGNFGAVGMGWIFSNEPFVGHNGLLSFGKLRASYGTAGNDQIGDYKYLDTYQASTGSTGGAFYQGVNALVPSQLTNPFYGWERVNKLEAGLELGFLQNRFLLNASVYRNRTRNQLVQYALPSVAGFGSVQQNLPAVLQNGGVELEFESKNISGKNFTWSSSLNVTVPNSKLIKYPNLASSPYATRYVEGKSLFLFYGYHYTGVDPTTGLMTFEDMNGDDNITSAFDRHFVFRGQRFYGGFQNNIKYKSLELDFLFQFAKQRALGYLVSTASPGVFSVGQSNQPTYLLGSKYQQKLSTQYNSTQNTFINSSDGPIIDASYIRLKNISLSWSLPLSAKAQKVLQKATVYMLAQNLLTITNYIGFDPETPDSYAILPPLRTITAGIRLSF